MTAFDIIYTKQEGSFKNGEFVVQKNIAETYTVFARNEKEARATFSKETNFGQARIKEVKPSAGNYLGGMFPNLAALKKTLDETETPKDL